MGTAHRLDAYAWRDGRPFCSRPCYVAIVEVELVNASSARGYCTACGAARHTGACPPLLLSGAEHLPTRARARLAKGGAT